MNNGDLDIFAIAFLRCTQCKKDQLYLFDIANSLGEQVTSKVRYQEMKY